MIDFEYDDLGERHGNWFDEDGGRARQLACSWEPEAYGTHRNLLPAIEQLEPEFRDRIVKTSYYGSGDERSSNDWYRQCDLILVLGTPRVPTTTVVEYLVRIGEWEAACNRSDWGEIYWHAETTAGESVRLSGRGYHDPLWMKAHRAIVRSSVVQAIGRGARDPERRLRCDCAQFRGVWTERDP